MKFNKKLFVPFLSSVIGLSIAGGLGGAFAWYQYNSQVTTSFIGTSIANTSILQIGHEEENQTTHDMEMKWGRDYYPYSNTAQKLIPVTFGALQTVSEKADSLREEGGKNVAFGYPDAGKEVDNDYDGWTHIDPNKGFVQYDLYLRAQDASGAQRALDVYLSDVLIEAAGEASGDKDITQAVRIHLNVEGDKNRLISKNAVTNLELYGELDLDNDGESDRPGGYITSGQSGGVIPTGDPIIYGVEGDKQTTVAASTICQTDFDNLNANYKICTTKTGSANVKITVTVWLEGWEFLKTDGTTVKKNIWNPAYSAGVDIRLGMTFDTGPATLPATI